MRRGPHRVEGLLQHIGRGRHPGQAVWCVELTGVACQGHQRDRGPRTVFHTAPSPWNSAAWLNLAAARSAASPGTSSKPGLPAAPRGAGSKRPSDPATAAASAEPRWRTARREVEFAGQVGPDAVVVQLVAGVAEEEHRVFAGSSMTSANAGAAPVPRSAAQVNHPLGGVVTTMGSDTGLRVPNQPVRQYERAGTVRVSHRLSARALSWVRQIGRAHGRPDSDDASPG